MNAALHPRAHRVGAVSFANTVPLIEGLEGDARVDLQRDLPARLADLLAEERIDVGLVPVVEYLRGVGESLVPGICIGARGAVRTVKVFSRVPLEVADAIAVDRGSRSSVALLRVLLGEMYDRRPDMHITEPRPDALFNHFDTVLVIGDRADEVGVDGLHVYDLGEMWQELTGLPFVFAAWVMGSSTSGGANAGRRTEIIQILQESRNRGFEHLEELARKEAERRRMPADHFLRYWREHVHYDLGEAELAGLQRFAELAARYDLVPSCRAVSVANA